MVERTIWLAIDDDTPEGGCVMVDRTCASVVPAHARIGMAEAILIVGEHERLGRALTSAEAAVAANL